MPDWPFDELMPMRYGVILADPPWRYVMRSARGHDKSPEAHYQTMGLDEISAMPVSHLAGPDCLLFLWSTWPHLTQALQIMQGWGFAYVTGGAWLKRTTHGKAAFGTGYILRSATEPFLVGKIGAPQIRSRSCRNLIEADGDSLPDTIDSVRREHSRKPVEMRQRIDQLLPDVWGCELFAREPWAGRDVWGNEATKFGGGDD